MMDYKKLEVYDKTKFIATEIYRITEAFPNHERFSLISQLRRAAVSALANIAEGSSRYTNKDFAHFLQIFIGSISELQALIEISQELKYMLSDEKIRIEEELVIARKMLINLSKKVRAESHNS